MPSYQDYLAKKDATFQPVGFDVNRSDLPDYLMDFQAACVQRSLRLGKAALFQNMGLGKGIQQIAWLDTIQRHTGDPVLLVAPLAVANQFKHEAAKIGVQVNAIESDADAVKGINVINYHKIHKLDPSRFAAVSLDECSILKSNGSMARQLIEFAAGIPYRLAATATPSPNDLDEFGTQAEFLGIMTKSEMVAEFFIQDGGNTQVKRLKGHAERHFWRWLASWSSCFRSPADIGFDHEAAQFELPPIEDQYLIVDSTLEANGSLFPTVKGITERRQARKASLEGRVQAIADVVNSHDDYEVIWCEFNAEADQLVKLIPGSKQVSGSMPPEKKEQILTDFSEGRLRVLITKPSIAGFGLNWQHCCNVTFAGVSDSYESFVQASGRVHRFGQARTVTRRMAFSDPERVVFDNLKGKAEQADRIWREVAPYFASAFDSTKRYAIEYQPTQSIQLPSFLRAS